jgi:hypothetical protein
VLRWLLPLLLLTAGCDTGCRDLCTSWYDYVSDECGVIDVDDERVTCIADYASRLVTDAELTECGQRSEQLATLRASDTPVACCPGQETAGCPWQSGSGEAALRAGGLP